MTVAVEARLCACECGEETKGGRYKPGHNNRVFPSGTDARTFEERFWAMVDKDAPDECWNWLGARMGMGRYGQFRSDETDEIYTHRVAYELMVGSIPEELTIDHLCRNTLCCNPAHLEPVDIRVNILRGFSPAAINARLTHCKRGHPLSGDNLWIEKKQNGRTCRRCKICRAVGRKETRQRRLERQTVVA